MESSSTANHVTLTRNVARIMREGLHPRRGPRSRRLGESHRAVYLFKGREDAADGPVNWLGDELPEDEPVALIMASLPKEPASSLRRPTTNLLSRTIFHLKTSPLLNSTGEVSRTS
jgi:hypothetical protein